MFYLNHDNIENLIREAAKNYQINTDDAFDWDRIDSAVRYTENNKNELPETEKKKKRRFIFWGFLLLSITLFFYNVSNVESEKKLLQKDTSHKKMSTGNKKEGKNIIKLADDVTKKVKSRETGNNEEGKDIIEINKEGNIITNLSGNAIGRTKSKQQTNLNKDLFWTNDDGNKNENEGADRKAYSYNTVPLLNQSGIFNQQKININKSMPDIIELLNKKESVDFLGSNSIRIKKQPSFYIGLLVAPDFTFVKFQKTNGIGISFGLIGGYTLNSKLIIETGVLFNMKKYYTKGEYFDKTNVPDLANLSFLSINGSCNMIEIPIHIRYRFASNKNNHNWTAAVGTSSYLMTKEYYDYSATANGEDQHGELTHYPSSKYLFATINFSAGYERKISSSLNLRAEPYFKIPVKGMGTGNLHMSSTGINFEITKSFR
jgi:hypothetical protein